MMISWKGELYSFQLGSPKHPANLIYTLLKPSLLPACSLQLTACNLYKAIYL